LEKSVSQDVWEALDRDFCEENQLLAESVGESSLDLDKQI